MSDDWSDAQLDWIKPRDLNYGGTCPMCRTETMFHPAHRWGPCQVTVDGVVCDCKYAIAVPPSKGGGA
jgi:hypothetical protein